ncbi:MAG TPA: MYG1 family protein [Candidatus Paceibacterota bacterium]|nr:MYG1 family protein [Candidatus Paceibacterota bacterium]
METSRKMRVITHSGPFHTDDVFAVASLDLLLQGDYELVRTRDPEVIKTGDFVLDVGGVYDPEKNLFDHHQEGGAGERDGIPYSSLGLVWKKYGAEICRSPEVAREIEDKLVLATDATDCGVDIIPKNDLGVHVPHMYDVIKSFRPSWKEEKSFDEGFQEALAFAKGYLTRSIFLAHTLLESKEKVLRAYEQASDKRIVVFEKFYPSLDALENFPEVLYVVYPYSGNQHWVARAFRSERDSFRNRKDFPKAWAGKTNEELAKISGVSDAMFCHNGVWICSARSKEGAIALATLAADA